MTVARDNPERALPRYTRWADVPAGLYTRTQLLGLDPPRRPAPEARPRGRALYHGNKYADLYHVDDTVVKPPASQAQRAAAARARQLKHVCRWCGHVDDEPLGRGRLCDGCHNIRQVHARHREAHRDVARMLRPTTVAAAAVNGPGGRLDVALVAAAGGEILGRWQVDPHGRYEDRALVLVAMQAVLERAGALHSKQTTVWDAERGLTCTTPARCDLLWWDNDQWQTVRQLRVADPALAARNAYPDDGGRPDYELLNAQDQQRRQAMQDWPRLADLGGTVQPAYARWWGDYRESGAALPVSLRWNLPLPGATGTNPVADARGLLAVLRAVAEGTAAVAPTAPWHGVRVEEVPS